MHRKEGQEDRARCESRGGKGSESARESESASHDLGMIENTREVVR